MEYCFPPSIDEPDAFHSHTSMDFPEEGKYYSHQKDALTAPNVAKFAIKKYKTKTM